MAFDNLAGGKIGTHDVVEDAENGGRVWSRAQRAHECRLTSHRRQKK
jgi:hypothetical protein